MGSTRLGQLQRQHGAPCLRRGQGGRRGPAGAGGREAARGRRGDGERSLRTGRQRSPPLSLRSRAATDSHERPGHRPGTEPALPQRREEVPLTGARAPEFVGAAGVNGSVRGSRQAQKGERAASRGREQSEPLAFPNRLARGGNLSVVFPTARGCWGGGTQREPRAAAPRCAGRGPSLPEGPADGDARSCRLQENEERAAASHHDLNVTGQLT